MSGFEEITQSQDPFGPTYVNITVPPPPVDNTGVKQVIVGVSVAGAFLVLIILLLRLVIYFRHKGNYETCEAKGQENADNPDDAIMLCPTGVPEIQMRQEWFM